jgi:hypothetical protein
LRSASETGLQHLLGAAVFEPASHPIGCAGLGVEIESCFPADGSRNAMISGASHEGVDFAIERARQGPAQS